MPENARQEITEAEAQVMKFLETVQADPHSEELRIEMRRIGDEGGSSLRELANDMLADMAGGFTDELVEEGITLLMQLSKLGIQPLEQIINVLRRAAAACELPADDGQLQNPSNNEVLA